MKVFISYAREDQPSAEMIYDSLLKVLGIYLWLDVFSISPGADWENEIINALEDSDYVIIVLSNNSVNKRGYVQKEIKVALSIYETFPPGEIFLIPVRIDDVVPTHPELKKLHWVDLFDDPQGGISNLAKFFETRLKDEHDFESTVVNHEAIEVKNTSVMHSFPKLLDVDAIFSQQMEINATFVTATNNRNKIIVKGKDKTLVSFDLNDQKKNFLFPAGNIRFSRGKDFMIIRNSGETQIWDLNKHERILDLPKEHQVLDMNKKWFITRTAKGESCIWDSKTLKIIQNVEGVIPKYLSSDSSNLAVGMGESSEWPYLNKIQLFDIINCRVIFEANGYKRWATDYYVSNKPYYFQDKLSLNREYIVGVAVYNVAFKPNDDVTYAFLAKIWSSVTGDILKDYWEIEKKNWYANKQITFYPDYGRILIGKNIIETTEFTQLMEFANKKSVFAFSPVVPVGAYADRERIILASMQFGKWLHVLKGHSANVNSIDFSGDGKLLISGSGWNSKNFLSRMREMDLRKRIDDNSLRIWDIQTGNLLNTIDNFSEPVTNVKFLSGEKYIVTTSGYKSQIWQYN